ncbi:MAG: RibD family protein [Spirochaetaceae bacterium]
MTSSEPSKGERFSRVLEETVSRVSHRPAVTLAYAQSLDGSIALRQGEQTLLSGEASSRFTHTLRGMHEAIAVGVGTVLADDPRLTCRGVDAPSPVPVIFDRRLRTPAEARLFSCHPLVYLVTTPNAAAEAGERYRSDSTVLLPLLDPVEGADELYHCLTAFKVATGVSSLMVEGGGRLLASFIGSGTWDLAAVTLAPRYIGGYRLSGGFDAPVRILSCEKLGEDLLLILEPGGGSR